MQSDLSFIRTYAEILELLKKPGVKPFAVIQSTGCEVLINKRKLIETIAERMKHSIEPINYDGQSGYFLWDSENKHLIIDGYF